MEEVLHRIRIEFRDDATVIHSDPYPFNGDDVVLPPESGSLWIVESRTHDFNLFVRAKSVWCKAEVVGDDDPLLWRVAQIDHSLVSYQSE